MSARSRRAVGSRVFVEADDGERRRAVIVGYRANGTQVRYYDTDKTAVVAWWRLSDAPPVDDESPGLES